MTSGRARSGASSATAPRWKSFPSTAALSTTARSSADRRSSRAARSAWIVGGTASVGEVGRGDPGSVLPCEQAVVDEHLEHLLDEQRVPLRRLEDPCAGVLGELGLAEEVAHQELAFASGERLEEHRGRVHLAAAPCRPRVEELGSGEADEQDRRVARPVRDVVDEVEEGRLGPVHVVEDDDERLLARHLLEQLAHGEEQLLRARRHRSSAGLDSLRRAPPSSSSTS